MAQKYQSAPRGEARREAILKATLDVIAAHGTDGVTHRAVAAAAGVPLSATTYWFSSRDELLEETLRYAASAVAHSDTFSSCVASSSTSRSKRSTSARAA